MTTTRSLPKTNCRPLMRQLLRRNRAAGICFFVGSFLCFPLQYILEVFRRLPEGFFYDQQGPARVYQSMVCIFLFVAMAAAPLLLALVQAAWMHSRRGVDFYHSLPVSRTGILLANAGAAFFPIAVPLTADYLIIAVADLIRRGMMTPGDVYRLVPPLELLLDYLGWLATAAAIIAVTLLVATQVGGVFENFLFAVELLCAPVGLYLVFNTLCHSYLAGFSMASYLDEMLFTSPLTMMVGRLLLWERYVSPPAVVSWCVPLWCVLAALLLWAACRLYQNRPGELAETSGAREPLNTLGKLGLAYMGGLLLALILHNNLFSGRAGTFWLTALCCVTLVVVTTQVILGRGFHSLKKALPGMAAVVAVITVFAYGMGHGGFGYSTYIPKDPESVTLSFRGRYGQLAERCHADVMSVNENGQYAYDSEGNSTFTTPEGIALVADLHRALAKQAMEADRFPFAGMLRFRYSDGTVRFFGQWGGGSYFFPARNVEPILALEESRALREQTDPRFTLTAEEVQAVRVTDATGLATGGPVTGREAIARLVEAMRLDAEAFDPAVLREGEARAVAYLTVETPLPKGEHWSDARIDKDCWRSFTLPVYRTDAHTYEALWTVLGRGEMTGRLHQEEVTALDIQWWGSPADTRGAYWVGTGPESLFPTRTPADPLPSLNNSLPHKCIRITDPGEVRQILDACLGRDCHLADAEGFIVTIQGGDRTGCSFWLGMEEMTPGLRKWYEEEDLAKYRRVAQ